MARSPSPVSSQLSSGVVPGLTATLLLTVAPDDTAEWVRSGDVPVLATPRLVALCEESSCRALDGRLGPDRTTVASRVQFDHLMPVPIGATVAAEATLERVEGRRLIFTVSVTVGSDRHSALVAAGRVTRVMVDRERFLAKAGGCLPPLL